MPIGCYETNNTYFGDSQGCDELYRCRRQDEGAEGEEMTYPTRSSCYTHLAKQAADALGIVNFTNPDDVFKAIIKGQQVDKLEIARLMVNKALYQMRDDHA